MTAHRPKKSGLQDDSSLIDILFSGIPTPGSGWMVGRHTRVWRPPTDVYETENHIVVQMEIAGVRQDDFSIVLHDGRLTITGTRGDSEPERRAYHQMEIHLGEFRSDVELLGVVDEQGITAEYNQGFLRVILPKAKPQTIQIK
jgi:HSP20 family protein